MKIDILEISKTFDSRRILDKISFTLKPGEIFAIMGPNGSGKTTLLRLLNHLDYPSEGRILVDGNESTSTEVEVEIRRRMGFVFQNPTVFNTSVYNNIAYPLGVRGIPEDEVSGMVENALRLLSIEEFKDKPASVLSGGEVQRLAVARVLVYEPELLLLDEPTANADPHNVSMIEDVIKQVVKKRDVGVLMVTHNIFQAKRLAHMTGFIINGRLIEVAETQKLFSNPVAPRTEAFIRGEMIY